MDPLALNKFFDSMLYILDERGDPQPAEDMEAWFANQLAIHLDERHIIAYNTYESAGTQIEVSTVFMGINLRPQTNPPFVFETLVFRNDDAAECERYSTKEEALAGHHTMCQLVLAELKK